MTAVELIAKLQTVPPGTLVVAEDRYTTCDIDFRVAHVAPDKNWAEGAFQSSNADAEGAVLAVIL